LRRRVAPGVLVGGIALVITLGIAVLAPPGPSAGPAATFTASRVQVSVRVSGDGDRRVVEAVFAPDAPDLHLYGPDLPPGGVDGAGRPTRLTVVGGGWSATGGGTPSVDPTPYPTMLPGFSAPFSILPPGAVTVRLPIAPNGDDRGVVRVSLTYMACTADGRCFAPVVGRELEVAVP
jgi:hypothetical protein